ncbi:hypothetical protein [Pantanalinema sp. GBBB05]|uniref:hypothetical protein n=1 Tax=Pantanalinema sp. GBBB05 TaxID=2604139 RepID=UPI001DB5C928|nr:hypothetical protein [Pantanalinema sp. GBBB05]
MRLIRYHNQVINLDAICEAVYDDDNLTPDGFPTLLITFAKDAELVLTGREAGIFWMAIVNHLSTVDLSQTAIAV